MSNILLQKEEEYRKLNEELQSHNKKLMEEFDNVMKKQDMLQELTQNTVTFNYIKLHKKPEEIKISAKENLEEKIAVDGVPDSVDEMGVKGMSHFYRAKIKAVQNEYQQLQQAFKNKCDEARRINKENYKLVEEKDKWFQAYNSSKAQIGKLENQALTLSSKYQSKEAENTLLKKEIDQLRKQLKSISSNTSGHEVRLNRTVEEMEKVKAALKIAKQEEKDLRENHRKEVSDMSITIKRLEKQKSELLAAFKKQMLLIDNLRMQKVYLESSKLAQLSEMEFLRILDWKAE